MINSVSHLFKSIIIPDRGRSHSLHVQKCNFLCAVKDRVVLIWEWGNSRHIGARNCFWTIEYVAGDRQIWNTQKWHLRNLSSCMLNLNQSLQSLHCIHATVRYYGISWGNFKKGVTYVSLPNRHPVHCSDKHNPRSPSQRSQLGLLSLAYRGRADIHTCISCHRIKWIKSNASQWWTRDMKANQNNNYLTYLHIAFQHVQSAAVIHYVMIYKQQKHLVIPWRMS